MADLDIEPDVRAMFDAIPPAPDAEAFAAGVRTRIERGRRLRLALLTAVAAAAGLMAGAQAGGWIGVSDSVAEAGEVLGRSLSLQPTDQALGVGILLAPLAAWLLARWSAGDA